MRVLHNAFLWAYDEAPRLVRGVAPGDTARSAFVGQWLADLDMTLHIHHEGEDELLWDKLSSRAPACALHVEQMRAQHQEVQALLAEAGPLLEAWTSSADATVAEQLAVAYENIRATLDVHLRREVVEVIPVGEKVISKDEWAKLGEHGVSAVPRSRLMPVLGMLIANASPEDRTPFWRALPLPPRVLWRIFGKRQYEAQYRELFPGQPVPTTV